MRILITGENRFGALALVWSLAFLGAAAVPARALTPPYPYSAYITNITFNFSTATNYSKKYGTDGSDMWPWNWAADDKIYAAYGDGYGFQGMMSQKCSYGVSTIAGAFEQFTFTDIYYGPAGAGHGKMDSLLAISNSTMNVIYAWMDLQDAGDGSASNSFLLSSTDMGVTWKTNAGCTFNDSTFWGGFVQMGRNYSGNTDGYIYYYGTFPTNHWLSTYTNFYLARVAVGSVTNKAAYQYLTNIDANNQAHWGYMSNSVPVPIYQDWNGVLYGADYDPGLGRWLLEAIPDPQDAGCFALYEGPTLWGPWKTIIYTTNWDNLENNTTYSNAGNNQEGFSFPQKYQSSDGKSLGMFMSVYDTSNTAWNDQLLTMTVNLQINPAYLPHPVFAEPAVSGGNLVLTGTNGPSSETYYLLTSTNAALPVAFWTPVLTNNFGGDGSFSNAVPINPSDTGRFYKIMVP